MKIGIPKETKPGETRVAATPDSAKKFLKRGFELVLEKGAGLAAGFPDEAYVAEGARLVDRAEEAFCADIVLKVQRPSEVETKLLRSGSLLTGFLEPYLKDGFLATLARSGVDALSMELVPRTSRAQSMDALSSQANIAGYRAVLEAASQYGRFFPLMMTSAGSAKAAKLTVLGVGVAGLQAIATARRLGCQVEAYDVRPETREQVQSLGAKFIDIHLEESGTGQGGYAKELSEEGRRKLQEALNEKLKKSDIIIATANVPGRKAPTLVTEEVVRGMRAGSVIIDMAAPSGGNCASTEAGKTVRKHGVTVVGIMNYPALVPGDSSSFYARNLVTLLALFEISKTTGKLEFNLADDIVEATLVTYQGQLRKGG